MNLYKAVVEDNKDPEKLGRVRIRVLGVHSALLAEVLTEELPWTECIQPLNQGNTLGSSTYTKVGAWVYCTPLNDSYTEFIVLGSMKGIYNKVINTEDSESVGFRDPDLVFPTRKTVPDNWLTYGEPNEKNPVRDRVTSGEFTESKDTSANSVYPNNEVFEDHNGNIIEIDGTNGNSRIRIQHSTGARVEISVDGDVTIQASKGGNIWMETPGLFGIGADGNLIIDNDVKITGSLEVAGDTATRGNIKSDGDIEDKSGTLDSLRKEHDKNVNIFNSHTHSVSNHTLAVPTSTPETPDPMLKWGNFFWAGSPK